MSRYILEALANISGTLRVALATLSETPHDDIPAIVLALARAAEARLEGGCSRDKLLFLVRTVLAERPQLCVEIGVLGGRSIVPCAAALRHIGIGLIAGIETWSLDATTANPTEEAPDTRWSRVDFPRIKREFYRFVAATDLTRQVRLVEAKPGRAAALFDQIDFLHVNGRQCIGKAAEAAILYACKVRRGGIVVLDDVDWTGAEPAWEILHDLCDTLPTPTPPPAGMERCAVRRRR